MLLIQQRVTKTLSRQELGLRGREAHCLMHGRIPNHIIPFTGLMLDSNPHATWCSTTRAHPNPTLQSCVALPALCFQSGLTSPLNALPSTTLCPLPPLLPISSNVTPVQNSTVRLPALGNVNAPEHNASPLQNRDCGTLHATWLYGNQIYVKHFVLSLAHIAIARKCTAVVFILHGPSISDFPPK